MANMERFKKISALKDCSINALARFASAFKAKDPLFVYFFFAEVTLYSRSIMFKQWIKRSKTSLRQLLTRIPIVSFLKSTLFGWLMVLSK